MTRWARVNQFNADWLRLRALEKLHLLGLTIGIPLSPCVKGPNFALKLAPCRIGARISITGFADRLCPGPIVPSGLTIGAQAERYALISLAIRAAFAGVVKVFDSGRPAGVFRVMQPCC
jgi:hypothetical protein